MGFVFSFGNASQSGGELRKKLLSHFGVPAGEVATAARQFPLSARLDVQLAVEELLQKYSGTKLLGLVSPHPGMEIPTLANVLANQQFPIDVGPLQFDEIDVGDSMPARCLKNALWLARAGRVPFAVLFAPGGRFGFQTGVHLELAFPAGETAAPVSEQMLGEIERLIAQGRTYRGRVISLEAQMDPRGGGSMVKVHRLAQVKRDDVILPRKTLDLLDRNIRDFVNARQALKLLRFQARKGLLFYGPPGTGKTHTIHYLASQLPGHTTLLITAEQVGLLGEYFRLARFLQPSLMVIEDVDLIARERTQMRGPGEEILLNKLLNEMDGLREDVEVIFILTTNRPEQIEPALVSRPGRIDQAIEFPLPDEEGRARLTKLYTRGLEIPEELLGTIVARTKGVSAAFIKELMRRCAQSQIEADSNSGTLLSAAAVDRALEEMLFAGGALNRRLLGAEAGQAAKP
ncbi:MAG TPA: ATP-binding protein [Bryobacteraceae bacterium]|jgi:hypothetical protein|nr:ATP-binding protein [Bryobacteraceae bacterium]